MSLYFAGDKKEKELKRVWKILPTLYRSFPSLFSRWLKTEGLISLYKRVLSWCGYHFPIYTSDDWLRLNRPPKWAIDSSKTHQLLAYIM